ncbi:MAG TPA: glycosyl hydrolase family 65 protein [Chitinispirillaceae bacterium]|nr:glycosyl hydrolase family 65 protein [Chitinispirillaceae bacterium]
MNYDPFQIVYKGYNPEQELLRESLCTLGNGYCATRGAAPESAAGEYHYPGTYVAGLYNSLKSDIDGKVIENESIVNIPNWLPLHFRIDDGKWFELNNVNILEYIQVLHTKEGYLSRTVTFCDDHNRKTKLTQRRFVHMTYRHCAGLETTILPDNWSGTITIRSAIDGRVANTLVKRYRQLASQHLENIDCGTSNDELIWLLAITNQSHIRVAVSARTNLFLNNSHVQPQTTIVKEPGFIGIEYKLDLKADQNLRIEKIAAIFNSRDPAIANPLSESKDYLDHTGSFSQLLERNTLAWSHLWEHWRIGVETENPRVEKILNLHIFHLLQTVSPNTVDLDTGVPPRGLHGEAYRGLIMWDELFIFPLLNLRMPDITRSLLMYRHRRLHRAVWNARSADYQGAMYPWQSGSDGREQAQKTHLNPDSGHWVPDHSHLEQHINIAIAYNIFQYYQVTEDQDFISFYGAEMIIQIARFWATRSHYNKCINRYEIHHVMGPDEFHDSYPHTNEPGVDNNAFTNIMVAWLFWRTLEMVQSLSEDRRQFIKDDVALTDNELKLWEEISHKLHIPFHDNGIISQFERYGELKDFDFIEYDKRYGNIHRLDRILESEGDSTNRYKVSKQADLLMIFYLLSSDEIRIVFERLGYPFTHETIPRNIDYYLERTSHGSTLSRIVHAWVLARLQRGLSWNLFCDALESDIEDAQGGTTAEGIHLGAMAGTVDLILRCYSGIESRGDTLWFNPRLPSELKSVQFFIRYRKIWINITISSTKIVLWSRKGTMKPVKIGIGNTTFLFGPGEAREIAYP